MTTTMRTLTPRAYELRGDMLEQAVKNHGRKTVLSWADDEVKVSIINTLAQMRADHEAKTGRLINWVLTKA